MKISQEANLRNLKQINEIQKKMKEIRETTEKLLKTPVEEEEHTVLPHLPTYKVGDGDFVQPIREDGQENKKYKSKGTLCNVLTKQGDNP